MRMSTPTTGASTRSCVPPCPRTREAGFSLVELLVVMVVIAIMLGVASVSVRSSLQEKPDAELDVVSGRVWRAIGDYRVDRNGRFPPTVTKDGLVNLSGGSYIRSWPEHPGREGALEVAASGAARPPASSRPFDVLYHAGADGASGWIAAYDGRGSVMFRRGAVASGGTAASSNDTRIVVPLG